MDMITTLLVSIPVLCSIFLFSISSKYKTFNSVFFIIAAAFNLFAVCVLFGKSIIVSMPWAAFDFSFSIIMTMFTELLLMVSAFFAFLTAIFTVNNLKENPKAKIFNASMLLAIACVNGAIITNSLVFLLIFVEALAIPFVLMILSGEGNNKRLAIKAFVITAIADLFLMLGIGLIYSITKTMNISDISLALSNSTAITAFICIIIGAAGKLGVMPFHSWMPEAADKTPVPFMVFMATAAEKILGVYLLFIALKIFNVQAGNTVTTVIIAIVALGAILAALLSNRQKSFKRMLIYTSISQGSFMMIAMLTALPIAIAGAFLHLIAHSIYKSCLFFGAGIMDNLKVKSISYKSNPYLFVCFLLAVASFIGVPLFAAFYSKEMIYEGALNAGVVWYIVMLLITFFCSSAVLSWIGKIFFNNEESNIVYPATSAIPLFTTAFLCLLLGIFYNIPLKIIEGQIQISAHDPGIMLVAVSIVMLLIVTVNFIIGKKKFGNDLGFVSGITKVLKIDNLNNNYSADPYVILSKVFRGFGYVSYNFDRTLNWIYDSFIVNIVLKIAHFFKKLHNGSMSRYIFWILCAIAVIILFFI